MLRALAMCCPRLSFSHENRATKSALKRPLARVNPLVDLQRLLRLDRLLAAVNHRNGFRTEYSGRNLAEYSVKIMGFGDERNIR